MKLLLHILFTFLITSRQHPSSREAGASYNGSQAELRNQAKIFQAAPEQFQNQSQKFTRLEHVTVTVQSRNAPIVAFTDLLRSYSRSSEGLENAGEIKKYHKIIDTYLFLVILSDKQLFGITKEDCSTSGASVRAVHHLILHYEAGAYICFFLTPDVQNDI